MKFSGKTIISLLLAAAMVFALASFALAAEEEEDVLVYENGGVKLSVPAEYDELLQIEVPEDDEDGMLFDVSEKASIEAAQAMGEEYEGAGWLFGIGCVDEDRLHDMQANDIPGAEVIAKDENGVYYVFYHPTDVRFIRESYEGMGDENNEDWQQWALLNEWAWAVQDTFLQENEGLTSVSYGHSEVDVYLARIAYGEDVSYTVSTTEFGPLEPGDVDPMPYLERLMTGVTYDFSLDPEAPDGEYVVLSFPEDSVRFDFFLAEGGENIIREVWSDEIEILYTADFADGETQASAVMQEWYQALAEAQGLTE